ncbi:site-specific recombinase XerC [Streptomyces luteogriseus]|uniref:hypothetical protein n=1 Tax=Streptomyces luteogriseus TaxID=68233 RepID=UPI0027894EFE|nr:hypothetical protein [Streptomyces luteogriseus]MDQ0710688.1 site-specific recombinase XerC [Streptomyces luteogriseus]
MQRDWSPVLARLGRRGPGVLPLSKEARRLVEEFDQLILDRRTPDYPKNIRTLTILVHWLGAENAILERDVHDLASCSATLAAKPVCQFLRSHGLLIDDPDRRRDVNLAWIQAAISVLPDQLASEIHAWVSLLRSQGRREGEVRDYRSIRRYFAHIQPVLTTWTAAGVTTARKITTHHIEAAVSGLSGQERQKVAVSLRSLFKALKRERMVFRDPTRQLSVGRRNRLPQSVRSDLLAGLMDQAKTPLGRLIIALVAIHALPGEDLRTIQTTDLNLARGTLKVRRGMLRHTLYLEEFIHRLASEWLAYRRHRWPASTNPYLLVSQKTALDPDHPVVSRTLPPCATLLRRIQRGQPECPADRPDSGLITASVVGWPTGFVVSPLQESTNSRASGLPDIKAAQILVEANGPVGLDARAADPMPSWPTALRLRRLPRVAALQTDRADHSAARAQEDHRTRHGSLGGRTVHRPPPQFKRLAVC